MKKITALLLFFAILFSFSACVGENISSNFSSDGTPKIKDTGKKLTGEISHSSNFSHGLALVCIDGDENTIYCINKKGNIIFEINEEASYLNPVLTPITFNGTYLFFRGKLYDIKGKMTTPEDVGVTKFYDIALEGGYILAENVVADFSSTKKELCVFDEEFNLIIQPSEELYTMVEGAISSVDSLMTSSYYYNDYVYFFLGENSCFLNLKTGESTYEAPFEIPSSQWTTYDSCYMEENDPSDPNNEENIRIDLREYDNIYWLGRFKNGKAPIKFYNKDIDACFFTLIDEQGDFQFDPVQAPTRSTINYDGLDTIIVEYGHSVKSYDSKGEFWGEWKNDNMYKSYYFDVSDGVILIYGGSASTDEAFFYNPDFTPLF